MKASKKAVPFFKQHFCENPSKLANLANFVSKKKNVIFSNISGGENIEKKKMSDICNANFDPVDHSPSCGRNARPQPQLRLEY